MKSAFIVAASLEKVAPFPPSPLYTISFSAQVSPSYPKRFIPVRKMQHQRMKFPQPSNVLTQPYIEYQIIPVKLHSKSALITPKRYVLNLMAKVQFVFTTTPPQVSYGKTALMATGPCDSL